MIFGVLSATRTRAWTAPSFRARPKTVFGVRVRDPPRRVSEKENVRERMRPKAKPTPEKRSHARTHDAHDAHDAHVCAKEHPATTVSSLAVASVRARSTERDPNDIARLGRNAVGSNEKSARVLTLASPFVVAFATFHGLCPHRTQHAPNTHQTRTTRNAHQQTNAQTETIESRFARLPAPKGVARKTDDAIRKSSDVVCETGDTIRKANDATSKTGSIGRATCCRSNQTNFVKNANADDERHTHLASHPKGSRRYRKRTDFQRSRIRENRSM